jgi:hypothetical protein
MTGGPFGRIDPPGADDEGDRLPAHELDDDDQEVGGGVLATGGTAEDHGVDPDGATIADEAPPDGDEGPADADNPLGFGVNLADPNNARST